MKTATLKFWGTALMMLAAVSCGGDSNDDGGGQKGPAAFSVLLPDDLEEIELDYKNQAKELKFEWEATEGVAYKVLMSLSEDMTTPVSIDLDASGKDALTHAQLDKALQDLGVKAYREGEVYWTIEGTKGGESVVSDARSMKLLRFYGPFTDPRDGEVYRVCRTVDALTGEYMVWLADNIRAKKYADGTAIPADQMRFMENAADASDYQKEWNRLRGGYYSWNATVRDVTAAENDEKVQGIAPNGWHVATREEWIFLINSQTDNSQPSITLKDSQYWNPNSTKPGNNASGFNAVAGGYIWEIANQENLQLEPEDHAYFWTSTMPKDGDVIPWNPPVADFPTQACVYDFIANDVALAYYVYSRTRGMQVRCVLND